MNEPDEFYVVHDREVARLAAASAEPACIVFVGGAGNPGARVCGHSKDEHTPQGSPPGWRGPWKEAECHACKREGLPKRLGPGFTMWSGWDHAYIDHMPPRPPAKEVAA